MSKEIVVNNELVNPLVLEGVQTWEDPRINPEWIDQILQCRNSSGFIPTDNDVRRHLHGDVLTLGFRDGKVIGFNAIDFKSPRAVWAGLVPDEMLPADEGVYFSGALIDGSAQKSGFYRQMNEQRIARGAERGLNLVFTETQNPNVEAGIVNTLDSLKADGTIMDYSMEDRMLLPGLYGRCMYQEVPTNTRVSYDQLNYQAGDAYGLIFHIARK